MQEMTGREAEILVAVIERYVEMAQPVPSGALAGGFDLSPASIRSAMNRLEQAGYLISPHTSAGRIPTEKAYRWYVTRSMQEKHAPSEREQEVLRRRVGEHLEPEGFRELGRFVAEMVHLATLTRQGGMTQFYGLANVFRQPEYQFADRAQGLAEVIDRVDELTRELPEGDDLQVYIGRETPLGKTADYSLIVRRYETPWGPSLFGVLGPTRMPYPRIMGLLDYTSELMGEGEDA